MFKKILSTPKGQAWFNGFWIVWDMAFFTKNLIEGDLFFMLVFAAATVLQVGVYVWARKELKRRDEIEARGRAKVDQWTKVHPREMEW